MQSGFLGATLAVLVFLGTSGVVSSSRAQTTSLPKDGVLYRSDAFTVTDTSVEEGNLRAWAPSRLELRSTYYRAVAQRVINFKFSLNGFDNERAPGEDHRIRLNPSQGPFESPVYHFGEAKPSEQARLTGQSPGSEASGGQFAVTFRVDLRAVFKSFAAKGYYDPPVGARVQAEDFEGVFVAGDTAPLAWAFGDFPPALQMEDPDADSIYTKTLRFAAGSARHIDEDGIATWQPQERLDVAGLPRYRSGQRLVDALYRLSLEELLQNVRTPHKATDDALPAGTFSAGAKWPGVWTRDVSYSIILALALVAPERSKMSLLAKIDSLGRIIQDTGTGGSWPVSTDRMTWALAAWEVYTATGDRAWLQRAYGIIRRSARADRHAAFDVESNLFRGESSFLDWREQSYPFWMDPKDIYLSENLGTNVVHHATYQILAKMARRLDEPEKEAVRFEQMAARVKAAINKHLWQAERGYYGQFRYGRNHLSRSMRAEALGNALAILQGVASPKQARKMTQRFPVVPYGVPSFWPYLPDRKSYHNDSVWPFVAAYWGWASAEAGNRAGTEHALASIYRSAALALSNKENFVASTGRFAGTAVNSNRQLWSVAGMLATVYRVFFGIEAHPDVLTFAPFVPRAYADSGRTLRSLRWRDATLDVTVRGWGGTVAHASLDGEPLDSVAIPAGVTGRHSLEITLAGKETGSAVNLVSTRFSPRVPKVHLESSAIVWKEVKGAARYRVFRNGELMKVTTRERFALPENAPFTLEEYQVQAQESSGNTSFKSAPVRIVGTEAIRIVEPRAEQAQRHGYTDAGYAVLEKGSGALRFHVKIKEGGYYALDVRYANGSGPVNTDNKAALRTVRVDGEETGVIVMPQRGDGVWDDWGYSNPVHLELSQGRHTLALVLTPQDNNMNVQVNKALLDHLRLTRLEEGLQE